MSSCSAKRRSITYMGMQAILPLVERFDQSVSIGVAGRVRAVRRACLTQDAAHMVGHRVPADGELCADLAIAAPGRDQSQDVNLPPGQIIRRRSHVLDASSE